MSYCRFSSDNWKSDVYSWADCDGGYITHVAANRVVGDAPQVPPIDSVSGERWLELHNQQDETEDEMFATLRMLRDAGYHVPDSAFASEEAK